MRRAGPRILWFVPVVLLLAAAAEPTAVVPQARIDVTPLEARVGDPLEVTFEIRVPEGWQVDRPELGPMGRFTFEARSWEGPENVDGISRWVWTGTVAAFETGDIELPALTARIVGPEGPSTVRSERVAIRVRSVLSPDDALADLKAPASIAPDYGALQQALVIVAALALVSGVAWWLHRRYAHRLAAVPVPSDPFHRMPPHEWVYRELQRLLERRLAEQGEVDRFFAELSYIVKRYLGGRYRVDLLERTTSEVFGDLRQAGAPREALAETRALLEQSDRVKFAGERPQPEPCREAVEGVYRIVDVTRAAEEPRKRGVA